MAAWRTHLDAGVAVWQRIQAADAFVHRRDLAAAEAAGLLGIDGGEAPAAGLPPPPIRLEVGLALGALPVLAGVARHGAQAAAQAPYVARP